MCLMISIKVTIDNNDDKVDKENNDDDVDDDGEENDNGANSAGRSPLIAHQLPAAATNPALLPYSTLFEQIRS